MDVATSAKCRKCMAFLRGWSIMHAWLLS
uniref:Uncharacterized protein n=1 Tax=Arundo donax TaxID=35708 RepID=A0A0A9ABI2_ARUDO